jgi:hypothetical protein
MTETYCFKCKTKTQDTKSKIIKQNGRFSRKSICADCGTNKSIFVKAPGSMKGGNPLMAAEALAPAIEAVADNVGMIVDNQLERGFEKKQLSGSYDRALEKNQRFIRKKDAGQFAKFKKMMSKGQFPQMSDMELFEYIQNN